MCVHVVVKSLNLEILRWHLPDYVKELKCVAHVQHDCFSSFNQSDHCFLGSSLPLSLLQLPFDDDVKARK